MVAVADVLELAGCCFEAANVTSGRLPVHSLWVPYASSL
jgi:hypothetical protein